MMELAAKRQTVTFDARTREITIEQHSLKGNSNRTEKAVDYALKELVDIWKEGADDKIVKTTNYDSGEPEDAFFWWAADQLADWGIDKTPMALLHRYRKPDF